MSRGCIIVVPRTTERACDPTEPRTVPLITGHCCLNHPFARHYGKASADKVSRIPEKVEAGCSADPHLDPERCCSVGLELPNAAHHERISLPKNHHPSNMNINPTRTKAGGVGLPGGCACVCMRMARICAQAYCWRQGPASCAQESDV